ncbi:MAG: Eco57I restriction-modification methylase domain-containing protein [Alphaproteobacteria bacterium]|nr:Eco57I restriction-modification methylase domain-containing protein [Alphaproteobacteria bacterium]
MTALMNRVRVVIPDGLGAGRKQTHASTSFNTIERSLEVIQRLDLIAPATFIELLRLVVLKGQSYDSIARLFFGDESWSGSRLNNGVVETPRNVANLIVSLALETRKIVSEARYDIRELNWLDPCVGAGVFPLALIEAYLGIYPKEIDNLPIIAINDLSPSAVFLSLCNIKIELERNKLDIEEYIKSGRLTFECGDFLERNKESSDLLSTKPTYDFVIGNPPYVRSTRLSASYRNSLKLSFPESFYGSADLYNYFISSSINCLKNNGVLAFITPAGFLRGTSSANVRKFIKKNANLATLIDLGETPVFSGASVHTAIYALSKTDSPNSTIKYCEVNKTDDLEQLSTSLASMLDVHADMSDSHGWSFHSDMVSFKKMDGFLKNTKPLSEFGITVFSGIRTGYSEAFYLNEEQVADFSADIKKDWIRPVVLPSNILSWHGVKKLSHLLFIPKDSIIPPRELLQYLEKYRGILEKRNEVDSAEKWYRLRACSYYKDMLQEKIIFPDLSAKQRFSICTEGTLVADGAYFIDSNDLALLGILNSEMAKVYFSNRCSSVGNLKAQGRFRFKKTFVKDFPLPKHFQVESAARAKIVGFVTSIIQHGETLESKSLLDQAVEEFYGESL